MQSSICVSMVNITYYIDQEFLKSCDIWLKNKILDDILNSNAMYELWFYHTIEIKCREQIEMVNKKLGFLFHIYLLLWLEYVKV